MLSGHKVFAVGFRSLNPTPNMFFFLENFDLEGNVPFFFFVFSRVTPTAYGVSQARGPIGSAAASLHHSHSNVGSKPNL